MMMTVTSTLLIPVFAITTNHILGSFISSPFLSPYMFSYNDFSMKSVTSFQSRTPSQSLFNIPHTFYTFTFLTTRSTTSTFNTPLQPIHSSLSQLFCHTSPSSAHNVVHQQQPSYLLHLFLLFHHLFHNTDHPPCL